jgi:ankyrin repeat protein
MLRRSVAVLTLLLLACSSGLTDASAAQVHELVARGDAEAVRRLLAEDASVLEARDDLGRTPLLLAAVAENAEIVQLLLEAGAEVDAGDDRQRTPFREAAWQNDGLEVLSLLLAYGADVNAAGFLNQPPLEAALFNGNAEIVDFVLDNGAALPIETGPRYRLMYLAAINGSARVFDLMFDVLPTLDPAGEDAADFLRGASDGGSAAILERLLATGIDPDTPDG